MASATYEVWADWYQYHEDGKGLINVTVTKALAATTDYSIGDVLSENESTGTAWTFSGVVKANGCSGEITKAQAICETTGLTPQLTLFLFTATPTCQLNDNAANTALLHADLANYIGKIDFPAMEDLGTGDSETLATPSTSGNLPMAFTCASNANDLYGVLVTRSAITGETAGDDMTIKLTIEQTYLGEKIADVKTISFSRGKSDELGKAEVGQLSLTINNDSGEYTPSNTGGTYYGYLKPKRAIGIRAYDSTYNYNLFYGYIEEIVPHPHKQEQDCIITAVDGIDYLSRHDMATALYKDAKTGTIHDYILTDANWLRLARLDDGQDSIPYWYGHDVKARFAQEEIDDTEQGFSFIDGEGAFNFEDRHHRSTEGHQTSQATFDNTMSGITYSLNPRNVYNIVKATVTPWELQVEAELWRLEEIPSIPVGETLTWWGESQYFVDAWVTPASTTDYTANSQSDGGGTNMTSDIAITTTKFAKTIKLAITNNGTVPAYITLLKARGTYYDDQTKVTRKAEDTTSQTDYQKRTLAFDGKYLDDAEQAQDFVDYAIGKYKDPRAQLSISVMNQDTTTLAQILDLEISDRVTIANDELSLTPPFTAVLRPNGAGDETNIFAQFPASDEHWDKLDEATTDEDTTYIHQNMTYPDQGSARDLYTIESSADLGTIYNVTLTARCKYNSATRANSMTLHLKTNSTVYTGSTHALTNAYADYSDTWLTNPNTGLPWTWADINALQAGITLTQTRHGTGGATAIFGTCTQLYVTVTGKSYDYFIDLMEHNISESGLLHIATYRLADTINEDFWCLDFSTLGIQTKLGY